MVVVEVELDVSLDGSADVAELSPLVEPAPVPADELPLLSPALAPSANAASPATSSILSFFCIPYPSLSRKAAHAAGSHNADLGPATRSEAQRRPAGRLPPRTAAPVPDQRRRVKPCVRADAARPHGAWPRARCDGVPLPGEMRPGGGGRGRLGVP